MPENFNAERYIEIKEGDLFSPYLIKKTIENLYFSGFFKNIKVYKEYYGEKLKIIFKFEPYEKIKKIKILCKKCKKILGYYKNFPFSEQLKDEIEEKIRRDLIDKGYRFPNIDFCIENSVLKVKVKEGKKEILKEIKITPYNQEIGAFFKYFLGKEISLNEISSLIRKIEKKYKKEFPYLKIYIKDYKVEDGNVSLNIELKNFEKVNILFAKEIENKDKKKLLKKIKEGDYLLEEIPVVLDIYKNELVSFGYLNSDFNVSMENGKYLISGRRGKRYYFGKVDFFGCDKVSCKELFNLIKKETKKYFNPIKMENILDLIKNHYQENGFLYAEIRAMEEIKENNVNLKILINEGEKILPRNVFIENFPEEIEKPELNLKSNKPISKSLIEKDLQNLQKVLNERGYWNAKVNFKLENGDFYYFIEKGERYKIGKLLIRGLYNIREKELEKELSLRKDENLSFKKMLEIQSNLFSTSLFSTINIKPSFNLDGSNKADLLVELKESPSFFISYGLGYDSYDNFRIQLNLTHINLFQKRYIFSFEGRLFENQKMWRISLKDPTFLNYDFPIFFGTFGSYEIRRAFSLKRRGSIFEISRNFGKKSQGTLRYEYQIQIPYDVKENFPIPKEEQEKKVSSINIIYLNDERDDVFLPKEGSFFSGEVKYSFPFLFADTNFFKIILQYSLNFKIKNNFTLAFSSRFGYIKNYKKEDLPIGEKLFLGGRNTLRAYSLDALGIEGDTVINGIPIGGKVSSLLNLEIRRFISRSYGLNFFIDSGQVFSSYKKFDLEKFSTGAGCGIFFLTPIGPLRIEGAYKLKKVFWDDRFQWYISFGFPF